MTATVPRSLALREAVRLLLIAAVPALLTGWLHPKRPVWSWTPPGVEEVSLDGITQWKSSVLWVDARNTEAYLKGHIPGAVSLDENAWDSLLGDFLEVWRPNVKVVVYCDTQDCDASQSVAVRLKREGNLTEIYVLKGGWAAWQQAHH